MKKNKKCFKCGYWNAWDAVYCNLCYEPFNKAQKAVAAPAPAPAPQPAPEPAKKLPAVKVLSAALLLAAAAALGAYLLRPAGDAASPAARPGVNRFTDKTAAADKLLETCVSAREALLAEIGARPDPEGFGLAGAYTQKLFAIEEDYSAGIGALALPCQTCVDKAADAGYLQWTEAHRARENAAMEDFNLRYQELVRKGTGGG